MYDSKTEYHFLWFIENYSYFKENNAWVNSPQFTTEGLEKTSWSIASRSFCLTEDFIFLQRSKEDEGPERISIMFEVTVSTVKGTTLYSEKREHTFEKGKSRCLYAFENVEELFVRRRGEFLPQDTLCVLCRLWRGQVSAEKVKQLVARTRLTEQKTSFLLKVENFSSLQMGQEKTFEIPSLPETGCSSSVPLRMRKCRNRDDEAIFVEILLDDSRYLDREKYWLIDASGNTVEVVHEYDVEEDDDSDVDEGDVNAKEVEEDDDSDVDKDDVNANEVEDNVDKNGVENNADDPKEKLPKLTRKFLLSNKKEYLPNDELTLMCELSLSARVSQIEQILHDIPMETYLEKYHNALFKSDNKDVEQSAHPNAPDNVEVGENDLFGSTVALKERDNSDDNITLSSAESSRVDVAIMQEQDVVAVPPSYPSVTDDLKALYIHQLLTDVELKTATKSFPAHKLVLRLRSSVFRSLLTDTTDCIQVDNLDDETVRQLLLFLYSDSLEDLQGESAIQLYRAGATYDVETLKEFCSVFLVRNLSTCNASGLLLLAETHGDAKLKQSVNCFILDHEEEVFSSDEWRDLSKTNPQLIVETMLSKYRREK